MKTIKISSWLNVPENFTGVVEYSDGSKYWYKNGKLHREDGPAIENSNGTKEWYKEGNLHREDGPACEYRSGHKEWFLNSQQFFQINLKDQIILDEYKGKYGLMWYNLLDKDEIIEYPDIPGLIIK